MTDARYDEEESLAPKGLRLLLGISTRDDEGNQSGFEIGYVFSRNLSYRSGVGDFLPDDTLLIRLTHRY